MSENKFVFINFFNQIKSMTSENQENQITINSSESTEILKTDIFSLTNLEKERFTSLNLNKFLNIYNIVSNAAFKYSNQNKIK